MVRKSYAKIIAVMLIAIMFMVACVPAQSGERETEAAKPVLEEAVESGDPPTGYNPYQPMLEVFEDIGSMILTKYVPRASDRIIDDELVVDGTVSIDSNLVLNDGAVLKFKKDSKIIVEGITIINGDVELIVDGGLVVIESYSLLIGNNLIPVGLNSWRSNMCSESSVSMKFDASCSKDGGEVRSGSFELSVDIKGDSPLVLYGSYDNRYEWNGKSTHVLHESKTTITGTANNDRDLYFEGTFDIGALYDSFIEAENLKEELIYLYDYISGNAGDLPELDISFGAVGIDVMEKTSHQETMPDVFDDRSVEESHLLIENIDGVLTSSTIGGENDVRLSLYMGMMKTVATGTQTRDPYSSEHILSNAYYGKVGADRSELIGITMSNDSVEIEMNCSVEHMESSQEYGTTGVYGGYASGIEKKDQEHSLDGLTASITLNHSTFENMLDIVFNDYAGMDELLRDLLKTEGKYDLEIGANIHINNLLKSESEGFEYKSLPVGREFTEGFMAEFANRLANGLELKDCNAVELSGLDLVLGVYDGGSDNVELIATWDEVKVKSEDVYGGMRDVQTMYYSVPCNKGDPGAYFETWAGCYMRSMEVEEPYMFHSEYVDTTQSIVDGRISFKADHQSALDLLMVMITSAPFEENSETSAKALYNLMLNCTYADFDVSFNRYSDEYASDYQAVSGEKNYGDSLFQTIDLGVGDDSLKAGQQDDYAVSLGAGIRINQNDLNVESANLTLYANIDEGTVNEFIREDTYAGANNYAGLHSLDIKTELTLENFDIFDWVMDSMSVDGLVDAISCRIDISSDGGYCAFDDTDFETNDFTYLSASDIVIEYDGKVSKLLESIDVNNPNEFMYMPGVDEYIYWYGGLQGLPYYLGDLCVMGDISVAYNDFLQYLDIGGATLLWGTTSDTQTGVGVDGFYVKENQDYVKLDFGDLAVRYRDDDSFGFEANTVAGTFKKGETTTVLDTTPENILSEYLIIEYDGYLNNVELIDEVVWSEDSEVRAAFNLKTVTVVFEGCDNVTGYVGESYDAPVPAERTGFVFVGWFTDEAGNGEECSEIIIENARYYPVWRSSTEDYTITFNTDGGSTIAPIVQKYGTAVTAPANPTREGYTFAGWDMEIPRTMPGNLTIAAQWTINQYEVLFKNNDGSEISKTTQDYGTAIAAPEVPAREGYTFAGWDPAVPDNVPAEDVTFTGGWTLNQYTVIFKDADGTEYAKSARDYGTGLIAPDNPTKTGYTFTGWDKAVPEKVPAEDVTFTAQWRINQYTITFDTKGGNAIEPITKDFGASVGAVANPVRDGYDFLKWDRAIPETIPAADMTITALWIEIFVAEDIVTEKEIVRIETEEASVKIDKEVLKEAISESSNINLNLNECKIELSRDAMERIVGEEVGDLQIAVTTTAEISEEIKEKIKEKAETGMQEFTETAIVVSISFEGHANTDQLGDVRVTVPYNGPEVGEGQVIAVYHIANDGTVERLESSLIKDSEGNMFVEFKTSHFSDFMIGIEDDVPEDDGNMLPFIIAAVAVAVIGVLGMAFLRRH